MTFCTIPSKLCISLIVLYDIGGLSSDQLFSAPLQRIEALYRFVKKNRSMFGFPFVNPKTMVLAKVKERCSA